MEEEVEEEEENGRVKGLKAKSKTGGKDEEDNGR